MPAAQRRRPNTLAGALLALALLAAQALALVHGLAHLPGHSAHAEQASPDDWVGHHDPGSATCQLLDQLAHAEGTAPQPPQVASAGAFAERPQACTTAESVGAAAAYQARAPPRG